MQKRKNKRVAEAAIETVAVAVEEQIVTVSEVVDAVNEQIEAVEEQTEVAAATVEKEKRKTVDERRTALREQFKYDVLFEKFKVKSLLIRYFNSKGVSTADIAIMMNIRYQHVRNVLTQFVKKQDTFDLIESTIKEAEDVVADAA